MHLLKLIIHNILDDREEKIYRKSHMGGKGCVLPRCGRGCEMTLPLQPILWDLRLEAIFALKLQKGWGGEVIVFVIKHEFEQAWLQELVNFE